ncbi:NAD(P)/FAD-dependent oxidoreductase [Candidatus Protochlamydia phocaeensis]|uniref:NAD(P)/FAD-dependent oxidoreductase n=1 Tax=Candidatus Protochlamydia phocaeensis TaxID=1414722 RepID=UPI00083982FB|nr:NAD(P)/FAD-dependent oxidoreductase [Candidatus Protochlamydia phocaeensis]
MQEYDVVIAGAGPAGGQCARELSNKGYRVFLADRAKSFEENNYSSGGAPKETMTDFDLPEEVVGTYWTVLNVQSTKEKSTWESPSPFGPIFDFDKLRAFLAKKTIEQGGAFRLGCHYQSHETHSHSTIVHFKDLATNEIFSLQTKVLVDATGTERKVLSSHHPYDKNQAMAATGIEYHVQVSPAVYHQFAKSLNFFLGHHWMPQGYAWIFPMASPCLKIGVIRYFQNYNYVNYEPSYKFYLEQLLQFCGSPDAYQILDKHGKTIYYTLGQKDLRYQGPILAIGDAISSINPLGCEGIRHALASGREAAFHIQRYLKGDISNFIDFDRSMNRYFGKKWLFSEMLMKSLFKTKQDERIDQSVKAFGLMSNEEIMDVIFHYRFRHTLKSYFWYSIARLKYLLGWRENYERMR